MKLDKIKTEEQFIKFLEKKYGGMPAIDPKRKKKIRGYTRDMGRQYYSAAQSKAVLDGE